MTVNELIEFLQDVDNKELTVLVVGDGGYYTPCFEDSGICKDEFKQDMFYLVPCYGHGQKTEVEIRADEFEINGN